MIPRWTPDMGTTTRKAGVGLISGGSPRIVLTTSTDGVTWTPRSATDMGDRDTIPPDPGQGFLPQLRPSGTQVQPWLSSGGGHVMLVFYESRGFFQT